MSNSNSSALPTSSKLSRGIKGSIQRIFVGEKNNNQVVVYKYNITNQEWYKEYTISSPDSSILKFGFSLAGTDDASILAVGAPGTTEGRVYIYEKDITGSGWSQRGTTITHPMLNFSGTDSDGFGHSVALSQHDGNILVVGAPFYNEQTPAFATSNDYPVYEGRVFIFKYVGGTSGWAGSAYAFQGTKSSPSGTLSTSLPASWKDFYFGWSLDISDVGNMIIVGCPSIRKLDDISKNNQETDDLFFDTSVYDEYYNAVEVSDLETNWGHTGNAHVYHNHTVLSGGTTWTSNVNVTEVIGVTSIGGITVDTEPEKIRPFEAVGTSVGINRAGNRIFASAPYSYGTSNASPQIFSGRIYTLEWNTVTGTWDEMGRINKHINGGINFRLLGFSAEFDGSGNRIVSGAPEWVSINRKLRGQVETFDWNGEAWVSYPTSSVSVDVITDETFYVYQNMRFGDSVSVDGEGEMIAIGMGGNNLYYSGSSTNLPRPSQLSVYGITYIGGATTTVAGSDSHILTGSSNIWVYNNPQSMIVSGNMTVSGCMQTSGIAVGTNDDTDTSRKTIFFGGTKADNAYDYTVIENRVYESAEKSELLIFKGDNNADFNGGGIYGPDRIRLKSGQICFDLNTGYERDGEDIRFTMNKNKLQGGKFGVNTASPTEAVDVYGKIKSSQGFIGRGEELIGLDLHDSLIRVNNNTGIAGSSYNDLTLGEMSMISSSTTYPTVNLTSNTNQGYTVLSSFDVTNAWKAFDSSATSSWMLDTGSTDGSQGTPLYTRFGPEIGYYFGSTERFPGYPGEWIEIQMASSVPKLLLTEVLINIRQTEGHYPLNLHVFGSDNGTDYYHIHTEIKPWSFTASYNTDVSAFTRTPSVNDKPYNKFVLICSRVKVPVGGVEWANIRLKGSTLSTFTKKLKLDKAGKIGIGTDSPTSPLHVIGDAFFDGGNIHFNKTSGSVSKITSSSAGDDLQFYSDKWIRFIESDNNAEKLVINGNEGKVGINHSTPDSCLHIASSSGQTITLDGTTRTSYIHYVRGNGHWYSVVDNNGDYNHNMYWYANATADGGNTWSIKQIFRFENDTAGAGPNAIGTFTGQHMSSIVNVTPTNVSNCVGLIVSSNQNDYMTINGGTPLKGAKNIHVNEAIPVVKISTKAQDKACFGVISSGEDPNESGREQRTGRIVGVFHKESGDNRVYVNSLGEGGVWVVNTNGNLEAGDYITTSNVSGYGMKQTSEFLANYTVAKITMDCNFNPGQVPVKQIKKVSATNTYYVRSTDNDTCNETFYNTLDDETKALYTKDVRTEMVNDLDSNGVFQWEDTSETELAYTIRYLDADGIETTQGNAVHIAAFVGCTYHCG